MEKIFLVLLSIATVTMADYYSKPCSNNNLEHVVLRYKRSYGPKCVEATLIKMSPELIELIVDEHNKLRDSFARGNLTRFPKKVTKMATMRWDNELALYAEYTALQCEMKHDECHYTEECPYSGQNIAGMGRSGSYEHPFEVVPKMIWKWYIEHEYVPNDSYIKKLTKIQFEVEIDKKIQIKDTGHFTQLIHQEAYSVGCALVKTKMIQSGTTFFYYYFVCNYAVTNMIDYPVCTFGGKAASGCDSGPNKKYPNLCSEDESYADSSFFKERTQNYPKPPAGPAPENVTPLPKGSTQAEPTLRKADSMPNLKQGRTQYTTRVVRTTRTFTLH